MTDYREELYQSVMLALAQQGYDQRAIGDISNILISKLGNYEITERCTELAPLDTESEQLIKYFIGTLYTENKSQKTLRAYKNALMKFYEAVGKPLKDVTVMDFRWWITEIMKTTSDCTAENNRAILSSFYNFLMREEFIQKNPMQKIKPIKVRVPDEEPFNEVELEKIRNACTTLRMRCIVELALSSGARNSEICALKIDDVDLNKLEIKIRHGKGDKARTTYISGVCAEYLKKYIEERKYDSPYIFINRNGNVLNTSNITLEMRNLGKRAGVNNVHAHRFRKTLASELYRRGVDICVIQKILGHSNVSTTIERYTKIQMQKVEFEYRRGA